MTFFWVIIVLLFLMLGYLLWAPITLYIDTSANQYYVQLRGIIKANIEADPSKVMRVRLQVLFLNFSFYPLTRRTKKKKKSKTKKKKHGKRIVVQKIIRVARTFKVKKLVLDIDTGDCIQNAKLFPVFALLNRTKGDFTINFINRNRLALVVKNRPIHILKSFINL
ncbi:MAG: hypothetical protein DRI70_03355 [Bacteroidetes bacterium]|nr:MAG: hypothetical protein DRI70_03355 [Bacteroidota bacterium]